MTAVPAARVPRGGSSPAQAAAAVVLRVLGASLLATNAGIHAYLWNEGYRSIPTIGVLFLLDAIGASVLTIAVVAAPRKLLAPVAALGALLEAGTVAGLFFATEHPLFNFMESDRATLYWQSAITEIVGAVLLATTAFVAYRRSRTGTDPR